MKRIGKLYTKICSMENLQLADQIARRGKLRQYGVRKHDLNREANILALHDALVNKTFTTGAYSNFMVRDPKPREISALDYFPDRIVHHAIMNYLESVFVASFTGDSYSCIKGRGIHACMQKLKRALRDEVGTRYCLKLDITKFYPSINHDILKSLLRRKIKDADLLWLLDNIIDSAPGVPIGNYLSQYFANFYLTGFDHWLKQVAGVKYYFRYADDMVILSGDKAELQQLLWRIDAYLRINLKLEIKGNYQVFPVASRGIDFLGYVTRHTHIRLRKSIKKNWARSVANKRVNRQSLAAYHGWAKHADCKHLTQKLQPKPHLPNDSIQRAGRKVKEPDRQEDRKE